jgi:hypothetical protein
MPEYCAYHSLDELVTATLADFTDCGIDCLTKLALLEAAWNQASAAATQEALVVALEGRVSSEMILLQLQQLTNAGLLTYDGSCYHLTENPAYLDRLRRLRAFCADPELRARAAPLLRYRLA